MKVGRSWCNLVQVGAVGRSLAQAFALWYRLVRFDVGDLKVHPCGQVHKHCFTVPVARKVNQSAPSKTKIHKTAPKCINLYHSAPASTNLCVGLRNQKIKLMF